MKRLIAVLTIALMLGVTQQALAASPEGVWACKAALIVRDGEFLNTILIFRNWSDKGTVTIQNIRTHLKKALVLL